MKFPPTFTLTDAIQTCIHELDVLKAAYGYLPVHQTLLTRIREESVLKSALFSARIEGNPLTLPDAAVQLGSGRTDIHVREVENINNTLSRLETDHDAPVSMELLKRFHSNVLQGISSEAGHIRTEESAIYNTSGVAVYLTPAPSTIMTLCNDVCTWVNHSQFHPSVTAGVAHIWFEKIHPFLDGNGRVGRLLSQYILLQKGFGFTGIVPFEEYLDTNRQAYYDALAVDRQDVTAFVEFFCEALLFQTKRSMDALKHPIPSGYIPRMSPRRNELLAVIREHKLVSFDFLARRFRAIPERTLHYDIHELMKKGYVQKLGITRGALYEAVSAV